LGFLLANTGLRLQQLRCAGLLGTNAFEFGQAALLFELALQLLFLDVEPTPGQGVGAYTFSLIRLDPPHMDDATPLKGVSVGVQRSVY
jgi:hypothetical protein